MGADEWSDPHGIIPDEFREQYRDCETVADALQRAEQRPSTTPIGEQPRCPACGSFQVWRKPNTFQEYDQRQDGAYRCYHDTCRAHFDEPEYSDMIPKNHPQAKDFNWIDDDDLADPDERGMSPLFAGLDEETRTALAIVLYRPWTDAGPSYREMGALFPGSRYWVGRRVRAWKDGEYRDLVPDPRTAADETAVDATAVDDAPAATATATDGGRDRRPRRWSAFGT